MAVAKADTPRETLARERLAALAPQLGFLTVNVSPGAAGEGVTVSRDGEVLAPAEWGLKLPIDPGEHALAASAPGYLPWASIVRFDPRQSVAVTVAPLALDKDVPPPATAPAEVPRTEPASAFQLSSVRGAGAGDAQRTAGRWVGGVGLAALATGVILGIAAKVQYDGARGDCRENHCSPSGLAARSRAFDEADGATGAFFAGGILLAAAVALWISAPRAPTSVALSLAGGPIRLAW